TGIHQKQDSFHDTGLLSNDLDEDVTLNCQSGTTEDKEMENAAIKLQANFRGYLTRKNLRENDNFESNPQDHRLDKETQNHSEYDTFQKPYISDQEEIARNEEEENSAVVIQAAFRGHMARREMTKCEVDICTDMLEVMENSKEDFASDEAEDDPTQVLTFEEYIALKQYSVDELSSEEKNLKKDIEKGVEDYKFNDLTEDKEDHATDRMQP
ncbi:uncharacterized protein LOC111084756, partial [Limulus polyphemus]|uniref:Uncharacterized protein LOC111084756 n=1 Tax=Limulus polyphemus TaxID=6850 RepID=A0ABM1S081_LIMPO